MPASVDCSRAIARYLQPDCRAASCLLHKRPAQAEILPKNVRFNVFHVNENDGLAFKNKCVATS